MSNAIRLMSRLCVFVSPDGTHVESGLHWVRLSQFCIAAELKLQVYSLKQSPHQKHNSPANRKLGRIPIMNKPIERPGLGSIEAHMVMPDKSLFADAIICIGSNESVFGPGHDAKLASLHYLSRNYERYPDGAEYELCVAIARHFELQAEGVVCGHGSDDLLARLAHAYLRPGEQMICSANGYKKFPNYAFANDALPVLAPDQNFRADVEHILSNVRSATRMVMLANPDNPTGSWLTGEEVRHLASSLPSSVLLVLDSAYFEYMEDPAYENPKNLVEEFDNVVMSRTFSKLFGLAGLRIGWLYASPQIAASIRKIGATFPISSVAANCAQAALGDHMHQKYVRASNLQSRELFVRSLKSLGIRTYPSQTNFVLADFSTAGVQAQQVYDQLLNHRIVARRLRSSAFENCIRFTIGRRSEMRVVARFLGKILKQLQK